MRHAGRSCLSDMFYQIFELSGWQQRNVTNDYRIKNSTPTPTCVWGGWGRAETEHFIPGTKMRLPFIIDDDLQKGSEIASLLYS